MTGQQLYDRWVDATPAEMTADYRPWDQLHPYEQARWDGLAASLG